MDYVVLIVCVAVVLIVGYFITEKILDYKKNHIKMPKEKKQKKEEVDIKNVHLTVVGTYMIRKEVLFFKYVNTILPKGLIGIPKVALCNFVRPDGDKNLFNLVQDKSLDLVVFDELTMNAKLVIDLYNKSYDANKLEEQDPLINEILGKLDVKVLHILIDENFDKDAVKKQIFEALNIENKEKEEEKILPTK